MLYVAPASNWDISATPWPCEKVGGHLASKSPCWSSGRYPCPWDPSVGWRDHMSSKQKKIRRSKRIPGRLSSQCSPALIHQMSSQVRQARRSRTRPQTCPLRQFGRRHAMVTRIRKHEDQPRHTCSRVCDSELTVGKGVKVKFQAIPASAKQLPYQCPMEQRDQFMNAKWRTVNRSQLKAAKTHNGSTKASM